MKRLFIIIIAICFLAGAVSPISAGDKKDVKYEVKYEVKIAVTYNAVSIKDADHIVANAIREHQDACDVKVVTKKLGSVSYIYDVNSSWHDTGDLELRVVN